MDLAVPDLPGREMQPANLAEPLDRSFVDYFLGQELQQPVATLAPEHLMQGQQAWSLTSLPASYNRPTSLLAAFSQSSWSGQLAAAELQAAAHRLQPAADFSTAAIAPRQQQRSEARAAPAFDVWPHPQLLQSRQPGIERRAGADELASGTPAVDLSSSAGSGQEGLPTGKAEGRRGAAKPTKAQMEAKLKEKNKRAQKRFRDRQKSRLQESERQVSDLSARLNALLVDHNRLASRNSILEKVVALRQDSSTGTSIAPQDKGVPEPFIPGKPWNPAALLTISVRGQPFTLTAQQVRDMPVQEHAKLWKEYVDELGAQLLHTHGSKGATAVARVGQLVSELTRICACKAAYAPHHLQSLHMHTLDGSVQNVPGREVWSGILHTLHLTADQRKQLLDARQCYVDAMAHVVHTRQEIAAALQAAKSSGRSTHEVGVGFVRTHDLLQRLADNQREDQAASMQLMAAVWRHIWTPMQAAAALVQSFPWAPDVLEMLHALAAEEDGLSQGALPAAPAHIDHAPLAGSCQAGSGRGSSTSGRDEAPLGIIASFGA